MLWNGVISAVIVLDEELNLQLPIKISQNGIAEANNELEWSSEVKTDIEETIESLTKKQLSDDMKVEDMVRSSIRTVTKIFFNIKPIINVHILRVF